MLIMPLLVVLFAMLAVAIFLTWRRLLRGPNPVYRKQAPIAARPNHDLKASPSAPLTLHISPCVVNLLKNEVVFTDFGRKLELAGKQLALWLHDFISSQSNEKFIPFPVRVLHALCGSRQALAQFRPRLVEAAKALQATTTPLLTSFTIDEGDHFIFSKSKTAVLLLPEAAAKALAYQSEHDESVDQARAQRATVAM